jgi:hypothetical protein
MWHVFLRCVIESLNNSRHVVDCLGRWTNARFSAFVSEDNETLTKLGGVSRKRGNSEGRPALLLALLQPGVNAVQLRSIFLSGMYFPISLSPALPSDHRGIAGILRRFGASTEDPGMMW